MGYLCALFDERPPEYYIIANKDNLSTNTPDAFLAVHGPDQVLRCGNYTLYHISGEKAATVYASWYLDKGNSWLRFSHKFLGTPL